MLVAAGLSLLYIFLGVVPSNFCRTIPGVLLGHFLVWLLANLSFLRYSTFLCHLHTDKFPQSVVSDFERSFVKNEKTWV